MAFGVERNKMSRDLDGTEKSRADPALPENASVLVFGLGYVGVPLAVAFSREGFDTYGFDIDREKIRQLERGRDPTGEIGDQTIQECDISYSDTSPRVRDSEYVIVAVPTPVTDENEPNMEYVRAAGETIGERLSPGTTVVLESTVYPGATREVLIPVLEEYSQLSAGEDFHVGYSPERIVPGSGGPTLREVVKIVSGQDEATREEVADLYRRIVDVGVYPAPSMEAAEAAKCLENAQRDLNIAFVNEFAMACNRSDLDVDATEVLELAGTKWNFHEYSPGLVGGHCVPIDPYYLIHAFEEDGISPDLMKTARETNDRVPVHVAELTADAIRQASDSPASGESPHDAGDSARDADSGSVAGSRVLLLGLTYKPNTSDVRSPVLHSLVDHARDLGLELVGFDSHTDPERMAEKFDIPIQEVLSPSGFDALLVTTPHDELTNLDLAEMREAMNENPVIVDVMGAFDPDEVRERGFVYRRL